MKRLLLISMLVLAITQVKANEVTVVYFYSDQCTYEKLDEPILFVTIISDEYNLVSTSFVNETLPDEKFKELEKFVNEIPYVRAYSVGDVNGIFAIKYDHRIYTLMYILDEICTYVTNNFYNL